MSNRKSTTLPPTPKGWGKQSAKGKIAINQGNGKSTVIKLDEKNPQPVELIAEEIQSISAAVKKISATKLERRVILLLIRDITKLSLETIDQVLKAAEDLEVYFIKKK